MADRLLLRLVNTENALKYCHLINPLTNLRIRS